MSINNVSSNIHSASASALLSLQAASNNITQSSFNIAQRSAESPASAYAPTLLAITESQQRGENNQSLRQTSPSLSADIVRLSTNSNNAQASAKVLAVADETFGTLLDIKA
jgi:hypothetical protein